MNTVVKQECLRYNKLIWSMTSSLKDFRKAIKGESSVVPKRSWSRALNPKTAHDPGGRAHRDDCRAGSCRQVFVCQRGARDAPVSAGALW